MRKYLLLLLVTPLVCLVASCAAAKQEEPQTEGPKMVATIKDIMDSMVDPSATYIWESVGSSISAKETVVKQPRNPEEWKEERRRAVLLAEAAYLLVVPGRHVAAPGEKSENPKVELGPEEIEALINKDRPKFIQLAKKFQDSAIEHLKVIDAKDVEGLIRVGGDLDTTCENCHKVYWYPNDPSFKNVPADSKPAERK